jgi:hypothetical protein
MSQLGGERPHVDNAVDDGIAEQWSCQTASALTFSR